MNTGYTYRAPFPFQKTRPFLVVICKVRRMKYDIQYLNTPRFRPKFHTQISTWGASKNFASARDLPVGLMCTIRINQPIFSALKNRNGSCRNDVVSRLLSCRAYACYLRTAKNTKRILCLYCVEVVRFFYPVVRNWQ